VLLEIAITGKSYPAPNGGSAPVLGKIAFGIRPGEIAAIVGPSGCGKSTLMRLAAGLDQDFDGRIALDPAARTGIAFQEPRLLPWRSAGQNLRIAAPAATDAELDDLCARFDIGDHLNHFPAALSLGLARRFSLARAFAVKPDLLMLDEPFASLDSAMRRRCCDAVADLVDARRLAGLIISHDIEAAVRLADVVYVFSARPACIIAQQEIAMPRRSRTDSAIREIMAQIEALG